MKITITTRRMEITEPLRDYIQNKVSKLTRFKDNITEAHAILSVEKYRQIAEIYVSGNGFTLSSTAETHDMYSSIDEVIDKLERQTIKLKNRRIDSKRGGGRGAQQRDRSDESSEDDRQRSVVKVDAFVPKPISIDEAVLMLEETGQDVLMFRDAQSDAINAVFLRSDGSIGFIEPA